MYKQTKSVIFTQEDVYWMQNDTRAENITINDFKGLDSARAIEECAIVIYLNERSGEMKLLKNRYGITSQAPKKLNALQRFIKKLFRL